ncbi:16S rRNA (cytosine(967)-C(5))-methyltransferase RsmB [Agrilutibacter solisilvae]|uniref:16S rRNA (cytosine(967)-C(5))-methyltransferase n=1 Tax=Agrilutibacter solisilvae TaxID=2763317 RepID=A0A975AT03_9GAMM|nr:16S rRNA (cytosine(967)-C(5))-methyltransferase RsmB [Lysobacter solisilvae]QSX78803.1 16S rRNA (cytosine(967)-C(5))-methyltransferase RsmB [Lysobacter solisilvae]
MKQSPGSQARVTATRVLDAVLHRGRSLKAELAAALPALSDPRDRALVEAICFAALRQHAAFNAALAQWIPRPLPRRDDELRALLHVGLAQLVALALPAHAAVAATVDAARGIGRAHQAGLVNALLRRAQREGLPASDLSAQWPQWLRTHLARDWPADLDGIYTHSAMPPPLWLRNNRLRQTRADYLHALHDAGLAASLPQAADDILAPDALRLEDSLAVTSLPGFAQGTVSVQDISAQCVAAALAPAPGARVLDACAAPGGKSAHLLEREPSLRLTALDVDAARLERVRETLARLQLEGRASLRAADALDLPAWWDGEPFDTVLLDAPCSASGIVRRQPDVLLHRRESDLAPLLHTQAALLDALWTTLARGGVLLYATCSILKAENQAQIEAFLARTPDAQPQPLHEAFGRLTGQGRQRLPGDGGGDGFFYARLRRN